MPSGPLAAPTASRPKFLRWGRQRSVELDGLEDVIGAGEEAVATGSGWQHEITVPPLTLVHGDSHSENFLFEPDGDEVCAPPVGCEPCVVLAGYVAPCTPVPHRHRRVC